MFSLIITVISIALVAALTVATIYYGGPALSKGTAKAVASTVVSQGQQISGANTLFASENGGSDAADVAALVTAEYLSAAPEIPAVFTQAGNSSVWLLDATNDVLTVAQDDGLGGVTPGTTQDVSEICLQIEKTRDNSVTNLGPAGDGTADTVAFDGTADVVGQFGCHFGPSDTYTVYYQL